MQYRPSIHEVELANVNHPVAQQVLQQLEKKEKAHA